MQVVTSVPAAAAVEKEDWLQETVSVLLKSGRRAELQAS